MRGTLLIKWSLFGILASLVNGDKDCGCRLPDSIIPQHYDIEIITHLETNSFDFEGLVTIKVHCLEPTTNITLHSALLMIEESSVKVKDLNENATVEIGGFNYDKENDFFTINTVANLKQNNDYLIVIPFVGKLRENLDGYYRSSYIDSKTNEKKWLAVTQFEATDARFAFPCFDEPAMKAVFKIHLGRLQNYTSISNMPIELTEPMEDKQGWFWDHYQESVPMSTYLVAFAVTDFEYLSSSTNQGTSFRVWARHEVINQVEFAKSVGPTCLEYYEEFFNISYPLPKQDMIAIPDFGAGAMENWGLITYRESHLLYDVTTSSASHKASTAEVIAHELAHQWFGNLVTMKWWTDLWLNEGFATYMAGLAVHHMFPKWNYLTQETAGNLLSVFTKDSLKTSHPVSATVGDPKEISDIFDAISYDKGSFLLHMMANFLGAETFRKGVSNYLNDHKFNNAEQDDLWKALTTQAHIDKVLPTNLTVKTIMDTWTLQTGYPVVTVTRDYDTNSANIKQERFLRDTIKMLRSSADCWWVPITYTTEKALNFEVLSPKSWLSCPNKNYPIHNLPGADEWVLFNIQAAGLYRVNYDEKNWNLLTTALNSNLHHKIPPLNKVQLIDDSANLAWVGDLNYTTHFDVLQYLIHERSYLPWHAALSSIETLNRMLKRTSVYGLFKLYMKDLLEPIYKHIGGFTLPEKGEDNFEDVKHQVQITSWSCRFGVDNCAEQAIELFAKWQSKPEENIISKDFKSTVYCNAIKHGSGKEWNFLWKQYQKTTTTAAEKHTILHGLACTTDIWLLQRYLEWAIDRHSGIRLQDSMSVVQAIAANDVGYYITKNFLQSKIKDIHKHLSTSGAKLSRVIATIAAQMTNENEYKELKHFTEANDKYLLENKQAVKQGLETVQLHIQWQKKHYDEIKELFLKYLK